MTPKLLDTTFPIHYLPVTTRWPTPPMGVVTRNGSDFERLGVDLETY